MQHLTMSHVYIILIKAALDQKSLIQQYYSEYIFKNYNEKIVDISEISNHEKHDSL